MITVKIDEYDALEMLMERAEYWTDDALTLSLYRQMYDNYVYCGCFDDCEFDVMKIVDNDYVNWCKIIEEGDQDYDIVKKIYEEQGCCDCSCETCYSYIEAEEDGIFLVRI